MTGLILSSLIIVPDLNAQEKSVPEKPNSVSPQAASSAQPWLGVVLDKKTALSSDGIQVDNVMRQSPAEKAGIKAGDRIIKIQGQPVQSAGKLQMLVRGQKVGNTVKVSAMRGSEPIDFDVKLTPTPTRDQILETELLNHPAPAMSLGILSPQPRTIKLTQLKGRPTIVEFWATWCQPCKPVAAELSRLKTKHGENIHIVGISSEESDTIARYIERTGAPPYLLAKDINKSGHDSFLVSNYPIVFLLNAEHRVEGIYVGRDNLQHLETRLNALLPETAPPPASPQK